MDKETNVTYNQKTKVLNIFNTQQSLQSHNPIKIEEKYVQSNILINIINNYKIIKQLGEGKFSKVYMAECQKTQRQVALKVIKVFDMMDSKQIEKCLQEVKFLQEVNHPNIVKYLDSFVLNNQLYIAIEWADKGDLKSYIKKLKYEKDCLDELKIFDFTRQIALGLKHMHEKRIIHRDLKPANILLFSDGTVKLGDLGLGRYLSAETLKAFSKVGTPLYMSPELIRNTGYDFKTDVWSLGCVCYELIKLKSPFVSDGKTTLFDLFNKIESGEYIKIQGSRLSNQLKGIIDLILKTNPEERICLDEVIERIDYILNTIEDKPKVDPFIIMEDILEKLKIIEYELSYCKKYNKDKLNLFTFSCNSYGKPNTPGVLSFESHDNNINLTNTVSRINNRCSSSHIAKSISINSKQFIIFHDLTTWLIHIIKNNIKLDSLVSDKTIGMLTFPRKKNYGEMMKDLTLAIKSMGIKIISTAKLHNGFGEGVCLVITQLLDRYLISQNYIFKKPIHRKKGKNQRKNIKFEDLSNVCYNRNDDYEENVGKRNKNENKESSRSISLLATKTNSSMNSKLCNIDNNTFIDNNTLIDKRLQNIDYIDNKEKKENQIYKAIETLNTYIEIINPSLVDYINKINKEENEIKTNENKITMLYNDKTSLNLIKKIKKKEREKEEIEENLKLNQIKYEKYNEKLINSNKKFMENDKTVKKLKKKDLTHLKLELKAINIKERLLNNKIIQYINNEFHKNLTEINFQKAFDEIL